MTDRLVIGSGSLAHTLVDSLADRPGTVRVLTDDEQYARTIRGDVDVQMGDPTERRALERAGPVDIVAIADESAAVNRAVGDVIRDVFPDAYVIIYTDDKQAWRTNGHTESLAAVADSVLDPSAAVASHLLERIGQSGQRAQQLLDVMRDIESLAVVTHDNPDPDAIASGVALTRLAQLAGCDGTVCYYGDITHQENRAFVNLLDIEMTHLDTPDAIAAFDGVALVDHSRPGVNDQLPETTEVDIVIDHHPPRAPVDARFVDLRSDVGATSTLLVDYFERFGLEFDESVATALLFGIRVDTRSFTREVSQADFEAAATVVPEADLGTLERIETPSVSLSTLDIIASAIDNRHREGSVLLSCVGEIGERDALAQAADRILNLDGVTVSVVYGIMDGTIYISARSRGSDVDLGETLRTAFDQIGSAGGHVDMAGAQIPLGLLETVDREDRSLNDIVEAVVADRLLEAFEGRTARKPSTYRSESDIDHAFFKPDETVQPPEERARSETASAEVTDAQSGDEQDTEE
jgi:nanoRNase/pAp phosphatase (c-di-AMP/oligoRNAs hydrolase)